MPPVAAAIAGAFFAVGTIGYAVVYAIVYLAITIGLSKLSQSLAGKKRGPDGGPASRDVTVRGTVEPRQIIYGEMRTGGFLAFYGCGGVNNKYLFFVVAVAAHQCEAITDHWLDSTYIKNSDINPSTGAVSNPAFFDGGVRLFIYRYLGTSTQTVDSTLNTYIETWDSTHVGKGIAYVVFMLDFAQRVYPNGAPQNLFSLVKGRRLYDPRKDSTNGGSGSHRVNDATTWEWNDNWALATRDNVSGGSVCYDIATPDKRLTIGESDSRIDDAYIIAAANHADESCTIPIPVLWGTTSWAHLGPGVVGVGTSFTIQLSTGQYLKAPDGNFYQINTITDDTHLTLSSNYAGATISGATAQYSSSATSTTTQKRFTANCQLSCGDTYLENLNTLLSAGIGHLSYVQGKYRLYAGVYDSPIVSLTEDDILGPIEVSTHPNGEDLYNLVGGTFFDEDRNWQQSNFPSQTQSSYQTDDGGLYPRNITLLATRTSFRCQRIANVILNQSRNKTTVKFTRLSPKAMNIGEWETFTLTVGEYGWSSQVFRCLEWEFLPEGFISITAKIESSSAYADLASGSYQILAGNSGPTVQLQAPDAPTALTTSSSVNQVVLFWTNPTVQAGTIITEVYEHTSSSPFSSATKVWEGVGTYLILPKSDFITRYYWVRNRSKDGQVSSQYPASTGVAGHALAISYGATYVTTGNVVAGGDRIEKVGGTGAWDSQAYSTRAYANGCTVTFQAAQTNKSFMIGLNADPTTDASYASIDFALFATAGGFIGIYESGVDNSPPSMTYTTNTIFQIRYDNQLITYYIDGAIIRQVPAPGKTFFLDSSFYDPGGAAVSVRFDPIGQATPSPFVARGNCVVSDNNFQKVGGVNAWDSDVYSIVGYPTCHVSFKANDTVSAVGVGLNQDPTTDSSYTSIDAWWHLSGTASGGDGQWHIYESGTHIAAYGAASTSDVPAITYDGTTITYLLNSIVKRTVTSAGLTLFLDSSFAWPGGGVNSVNWGPTTNLAVTDSPQIGVNAATDVIIATDASQTTGAISESFLTISAAARSVDHKALVTVVADVWKTNSNSAQCYIARLVSGVPSGVVSQPFTITSTASPGQRVALQFEYDATAGTAYDYSFWYAATTLGNLGSAANIAMHVELVKR